MQCVNVIPFMICRKKAIYLPAKVLEILKTAYYEILRQFGKVFTIVLAFFVVSQLRETSKE